MEGAEGAAGELRGCAWLVRQEFVVEAWIDVLWRFVLRLGDRFDSGLEHVWLESPLLPLHTF